MRDERDKPALGFEVIDKRGANNPIKEPEKAVPVSSDPRDASVRKWVSLGYLVVLAHDESGAPLVLGRAAGLADDENVFTADYTFSPRWEPGFDWTIDAKRRLDTFLTCTCSPRTGHCQYHRRMAPHGWLREDKERIRENGDRVVPKVLEVLSKVEQQRQAAQRILTPRR